jgi:2-oxoglutarate ferredoxin oxidoreductase subunit delta
MRFGHAKNALGKVTINSSWCKGCGFCIQYCPTKVLAVSPEFNRKGYHPPIVASPSDCRNCGYCQVICPEFAIFVADDAERAPTEDLPTAEGSHASTKEATGVV